ncbi:hypothetical protein M405DRAFT_841974 [Rhizopogon salebrosus TDB-379]|nr:hypothetical protein M405DRAFT_841974 [Rhizopogon salebrosus TDB-379]
MGLLDSRELPSNEHHSWALTTVDAGQRQDIFDRRPIFIALGYGRWQPVAWCMAKQSACVRPLRLLVSQTITASTGPVIVVKGEALWRCLDYVGEMETSAHKRHHLSLLSLSKDQQSPLKRWRHLHTRGITLVFLSLVSARTQSTPRKLISAMHRLLSLHKDVLVVNSWKTDISHAPDVKSSGYSGINDARHNMVWGDKSIPNMPLPI